MFEIWNHHLVTYPWTPPPKKKKEGLNPPKKDMGEKKNVKMKEKW